MRIGVIHPQAGGVRYYRAELGVAALKRAGVDIELHPNAFEDRIDLWLMKHVKDYDILHTGYVINHEILKYIVAAREYAEIPFITDIDDDFMNVPAYNIAFGDYHGGSQGRRITRMMLRMSDAVSVSTPRLQEQLDEDCKLSWVLPNCVYPPDWQLDKDPQRHQDDSVRFMFAGNLGRKGDLDTIEDALVHAMEDHPNLRLFFLGCLPDWALKWLPSPTDPIRNRVFTIPTMGMARYRATLRWIAPDVIFAPVAQNEFNRSKSHIKAYDAAMCNAAFLCTDWDTYAAVPASAAIKVAGNYEWREAIDALVTDAPMRKRTARELYDWVVDEWHIDKHVDKWVSLYERVVKKGPVRDLADIVRSGGRDGTVGTGEGV